MPNPLLDRLVTMHAYMRPAGSPAERAFIDRYLRPIGAVADTHGNQHVLIGDKPTVLWSCHTDTVARHSGSQRVRLSADGMLTASQQLGADDTAGVFILAEMARRGVPGHYVFHYGEEQGCIGSGKLASECPEWLFDIKYAIALDRRGYSDVITHQIGMRTASDAFGYAMANELRDRGLQYAASDAGLFTDTERYSDLVPECTNLSVGYFGEHGAKERLDTSHVLSLLEALCTIDVDALPATRDPNEIESLWQPRSNHHWRDYDRPVVLRWPEESTDPIETIDTSAEPCGYLSSWQCCECGRYNSIVADRCRDCRLSYEDHSDLLDRYLKLSVGDR